MITLALSLALIGIAAFALHLPGLIVGKTVERIARFLLDERD